MSTETGVSVITRHVRGNRELPPLNQDDHYSTHFQEIRVLKRPVHVLPGDLLITSCTYNSLSRTEAVLGGYGIRDEMCVNYMHYYPATELEVCKSSIDTESLWNHYRYLQKRHLQTLDVPTRPDQLTERHVQHNYRHIRWTPFLADQMLDVYSNSPLSVQCNQSSGERFPVRPLARFISIHLDRNDRSRAN
jgi:dopamine beta-monooxygenase